MEKNYDVILVGAGPAGIFCAGGGGKHVLCRASGGAHHRTISVQYLLDDCEREPDAKRGECERRF